MRFRFSFFLLFAFFIHALTALGAEAPAYGKIPLSFEKNVGQVDPQVKFLSRGPGYGLFLSDKEAVLRLTQPAAATVRCGPPAF